MSSLKKVNYVVFWNNKEEHKFLEYSVVLNYEIINTEKN